MLATLRQRNFALLWVGGLISITGSWMIFIALPLYVYELTGSTLATSIMFLSGIVPRLLFGSFAGVFVDRWDRKRLLLITNLLFALALMPLLLVRSAEWIWLVYVVQFIQSTIGIFSGPAEDSLLPNLVDQAHLTAANSLNTMNNSIAGLIGPPLGGLILVQLGLPGILLFDAASFLAAAALLALIVMPPKPKQARPSISATRIRHLWTSVWEEWLDGLKIIRRQPLVSFIFLMTAIVSLGLSVFSTLFFPFAAQVLGVTPVEIGWLMAAQAVGGLFGGLILGQMGKLGSIYRLLGLSTFSLGVIDLALFNYSAFFPGMINGSILMFLAGAPGIINITCVGILIQTLVADEYRGRVFAALATTSALVGVIGTLMAGVLGDQLGIVALLNIQGFSFILVGAIVLFRFYTGGLNPRQPSEELQPRVLEEGAL
jgi:predicted MFS family arabinose efflux permease